MFVAQQFILARLDPASAAARASLPAAELATLTSSDLAIVRAPYVAIAAVIAVVFLVIWRTSMPGSTSESHRLDVRGTLGRLLANARYREGVIAQFFYVGAQITCWTFIIQYGTEVLMAHRGITEAEAEVAAQGYNIVAMIIFASSRFVCTWLLRFVRPGTLLASLSLVGAVLVIGTMLAPGMLGLYCLVGVSACMSLMFPTIYGIALEGLGDDAKLGAAGLIMAILGGSVLPPIQALIMDGSGFGGLSAVRASFIIPLVCFVVILAYGMRTGRPASRAEVSGLAR
jgi:FHS family L-fucose permease-like MFS transporter